MFVRGCVHSKKSVACRLCGVVHGVQANARVYTCACACVRMSTQVRAYTRTYNVAHIAHFHFSF